MGVLSILEKTLRSRRATPAAITIVTAFLLGQGALSIVFVLLSVSGLFNYGILAACLLLSLALGVSRLMATSRSALAEFRADLQLLRQETRLWQTVVALTLILIGATILQAWARLSFDAASAYFTAAKLTVLTDQFAYTHRSYLTVSGSNAEMTLAALILLFGDRSARLISWFQALAFAFFCAAVAGQLGAGLRGKTIVVVMVYTTTAFLDLVGDGKTDLFGAAAAMAAVWWLLSAQGANRRLALSICGLLSGLALLYRPTYVSALPVLILAATLLHEAGSLRPADVGPRWRPIVGSLLLVGLFASLPVTAYFVRNWVLFDALLVPALPAATATEASARTAIADLSTWNAPVRSTLRLAYPAFATFISTPYSLGVLTPLWLVFGPLLLVALVMRRSVSYGAIANAMRWLIPVVAALLATWILLTPFVLEIRYVLMLWGLVFVFLAIGVEKTIAVGNPAFSRITAGVLMLLLGAMIARAVYGVGVTTDEPLQGGAPLCEPIGECAVLNSINRDATAGDRVLVVVPYGYYLRPDLLACSSTVTELESLRGALAEGSKSFWTAVYDLGFEYLAYDPRYATTYSPLGDEIDVTKPPDWLTLTPIYVGEEFDAFAIEADNPMLASPAWSCQQTDRGKWTVQSTNSQ